MAIVCGILALLCLISGLMLIFSPRPVTRPAKGSDREYSCDKVRELLEKEISIEKLTDLLNKQIDINEKLLGLNRLIGGASLIIGVILIFVFIKAV